MFLDPPSLLLDSTFFLTVQVRPHLERGGPGVHLFVRLHRDGHHFTYVGGQHTGAARGRPG